MSKIIIGKHEHDGKANGGSGGAAGPAPSEHPPSPEDPKKKGDLKKEDDKKSDDKKSGNEGREQLRMSCCGTWLRNEHNCMTCSGIATMRISEPRSAAGLHQGFEKAPLWVIWLCAMGQSNEQQNECSV